MSGLKSSYEIVLEKIEKSGIEKAPSISEKQKKEIAEIRKEFDAKIAEKKILLKNLPELPDEIRKLENKREEKIAAVYKAMLQE